MIGPLFCYQIPLLMSFFTPSSSPLLLIWLLRKFGKFVQEKLSQYNMFVVFSKTQESVSNHVSFICLILEIESGCISSDVDKNQCQRIFF